MFLKCLRKILEENTMMRFMVSPNDNFSITLLLQACSRVKAKVVVRNMQKAQHYITAEADTQEDINELITLIETFYTIDSIDIDTTEMKKMEPRDSFSFEDEKLNQHFAILADAVTECLNNGITPNGYILSAIQCIHSKLKLTTPLDDFKEGDIIDCNYGTNMPYETSGGHIWNLVVAKQEHQAFVIPLFKNTSGSQLETDTSIQVDESMVSFYSIKTDLSATVLSIGAGRWISTYRISKVIGKASNDCLKKVITELPKAFDFSCKENSFTDDCVGSIERDML